MGSEFESVDRLMDEARVGPLYLRDRETAAMVVQTLKSQAQSLRQFELNAYVVMPNHVHLLITPQVRLADLTAHLQHLIAKRAGDLLELQGAPFWSAHNYEHLITNWMEQERIRLYIEHNPVRSGLASKPSDYAFSSATQRHVEPVRRLAAAS